MVHPMRVTLNIDDPVLRELRRRQAKEGKSLSRLVTELLARAMKGDAGSAGPPPRRTWIAKPMNARVDLFDREEVSRALKR